MSLVSTVRRLGLAFLCLELACAPQAAAARVFTLDDLLRSEAFGPVALAPGGRWLVAQTFAPYERAPRFDFDGYPEPVLGRLTLIDLTSPGHARALGATLVGAGYTPGPFSPSGRAMVIYRFQHRRWDTGVVDLTSGRTHWLGLVAEQALWGRSVQWRSDHELIMIALANGGLPQRLRSGWQAKARLIRLWRRTAAGRRPAISLVGSGRFAQIDPAPRPSHLVSVELGSGVVRRLASGGFFDIELSADGRYLAAISDGSIVQPTPDEPVRIGAAPRERRLTLIDLSTHQASTPLGSLDLMSHLLSWSPDEDRLLVFARASAQTWPQGHLIGLDAKTKIATPLAYAAFKPQVGYTADGFAVVRAGWLDGAPLVYGRKVASKATADPNTPGRMDWFWLGPDGPANLTAGMAEVPARPSAVTGRGLVLIAGGAAWRVSPRDRAQRLTDDLALRPLPAAQFGQGDRFAVNPDLSQSQALAAGPGRLVRIGPDGQVQTMALASGADAVALAGQALISRRTSADGVQFLDFAAPGAKSVSLIALNRSLAGVERARIRQVDHLGPAGERLKSWLYLPARSPSPGRWPLIVLPYPGAVFADPPMLAGPGSPGFAPDPQILAAHGYAVLLPSLPRDRSSGEPARDLADQINRAVDASLAEGGIDPGRIALWGHSFGGYAALVVATQSARYKAIVAASAPSDLASVWGAPPAHNRVITEDGYPTNVMMGWVESGQASLGGPPWSDPQRYVRNSPLFAAGAITTPLFLIYGDQDFVPLSQGEAMFAALYRQDKDAVLMRLWGEGHTPASPANIRALYQAVFGWLDEVLACPAS